MLLSCVTANYAHEHNFMAVVKQGYFISQEKALRDIFHCCGSPGGYFVEGTVRYNLWHCLYLDIKY